MKSPHVVQVLDHGIAADGAPFIVMELLEGSDLAAHCEKNGPMSLAEVDHVISQTCKALARAHERGIVHRDIKPQNIFLTNVGGGEPFIKVLDFGIAKAGGASPGMSSATKTGALMGTPYYMSPEQTIGAKGADHRTDLWALGVVALVPDRAQAVRRRDDRWPRRRHLQWADARTLAHQRNPFGGDRSMVLSGLCARCGAALRLRERDGGSAAHGRDRADFRPAILRRSPRLVA